MAHKIAYLKSKNFSQRAPIDDFQEFAKERGVNFDVDKIDLDDLFASDAQKLKPYDAIIVQGYGGYNRELVEDLARDSGLVTKCCFKENFSNLNPQNEIFVTCIAPKALGEFRTTLKLGREAVESIRHCELEIERATRHAYEFAEKRKKNLTLLTVSLNGIVFDVWYRVASEINEDYPSVSFDFENGFENVVNRMSGTKEYDVVLMTYQMFDGQSQVADRNFDVLKGSSTIAYLGDTAVGMYATENPATYSALFDARAISKMLEHSFDLPKLAKDWQNQIAKVYCQIN